MKKFLLVVTAMLMLSLPLSTSVFASENVDDAGFFKARGSSDETLKWLHECNTAPHDLKETMDYITPDASSFLRISGYEPDVFISKDIDIPNDIIIDIIKNNPDAENIIIYDYYDADTAKDLGQSNMNFFSFERVKNVEKTVKQTNVAAKDCFVISVAKGQTATLSSKWSESLEATVSGPLNSGLLGLKGQIKKEYSTTLEFKGPPETSTKNSREYRVRFYQNTGTYTALYSSGAPGCGGMYRPVSGNYTEPTKFASYAVDKQI